MNDKNHEWQKSWMTKFMNDKNPKWQKKHEWDNTWMTKNDELQQS